MVPIRSAVLVAALGFSALLPTAASASTVRVDGPPTTLVVTGTDAADGLTVSGTPDEVVVTDASSAIDNQAPGECRVSDLVGRELTCSAGPGSRYARLRVESGDAPDGEADVVGSAVTGFPGPAFTARDYYGSVSIIASGALRFAGGPQAEAVDADRLDGDTGGGDDLLNYGTGAPSGGAGDDIAITGGAGASFDGGAGRDSVLPFGPDSFDGDRNPRPVTVRVDGDGTTTGNGVAGQNLTLTRVENAYGSDGADTLVGDEGQNTLIGGGGADTLEGGPGGDLLVGFLGGDALATTFNEFYDFRPDGASTMRATDGEADRVDCGGAPAGTTVAADAVDALVGCPASGAGTTLTPTPVTPPTQVEVPVTVPVTVPVPVADSARATLTTTAPATARAATLRRTGRYAFSFTADEAGVATSTLSATPRGLARIARAGDVVLATRSTTATAGRAQRVTLSVGRKLRKLLRKGRTVRLEVRFVDRGGNVTTATKRIRIR